jgi:hypothetical protein
MNYPHTWATSIAITVTKCSADGLGNTDVEASVFGVALKPFKLLGVVVGPAVGQAGFDDVRSRIEAEVTDQIADALGQAS